MKQFLKVDYKKCIGCRICEQICSWVHFGRVQPSRSRIKIARIYSENKNMIRVCTGCIRAPCIDICPTNALSKKSGTNAVVVDQQKCNGCGKCLSVCPNKGIFMYNNNMRIILICDLCQGNPQCVKYCPENAIKLIQKR